MTKEKILKLGTSALEKCDIALRTNHYTTYGEYLNKADFEAAKMAAISFFEELGKNRHIQSIEKMHSQQMYDISSIKKFIENELENIDFLVTEKENKTGLKQYDVFVSHSSLDKESYVNSIKVELEKLGINIFYDTDEINWGDDWIKSIENGLTQCEFAIVVISKHFFNREWTEKELKTLLTFSNDSGQKLILPILYNVKASTVFKRYPQLTTIQYIDSSKYSQKDIAILFAKELIKRLKR